MFRELIDLSLIKVRDRLEVGGTVAVLDEKSLIIFEPVRRSRYGVVPAIGSPTPIISVLPSERIVSSVRPQNASVASVHCGTMNSGKTRTR